MNTIIPDNDGLVLGLDTEKSEKIKDLSSNNQFSNFNYYTPPDPPKANEIRLFSGLATAPGDQKDGGRANV